MNTPEYKTEIEENIEKVLKEIAKAIDSHNVREASDWLFVLDKLEKRI